MTDPTTTHGLFGGLFARGAVADAVSDRAWIRAMLDVEVALARALADIGCVLPAQAERVAVTAAALDLDPSALGREAAAGAGNPVPVLVAALAAGVDDGSTDGRAAAGVVHRGATSQDVLDSAAMLIVRRSLPTISEDLGSAADAAAALARTHRDQPIVGRTLLQQAVPLTFGLKAATWMTGLDQAIAHLAAAADVATPAQLGGAVGTLASLGDDGPAVLTAFARRLNLREPVIPWHTVRVAPAALAGALGTACSITGKVARDITLLAQAEVGEAWEQAPGRGGSSTMPHKRNPVAAVTAAACAARAPGLISTILSVGAHEHERAAGGWHAEWEPLSELLRVTGSGASWIHESLSSLQVDPVRMATNIGRTDGLVLAEAITSALTPGLGRLTAHDLVTAACRRVLEEDIHLRTALLDSPQIRDRVGAHDVDRMLDPANYLGSSGAFIDRALVAHAAHK